MSATRDKTQKSTFVYTNLYQLYRKGKDASTASPSYFEVPRSSQNVLKAGDLREPQVEVAAHKGPEFIAKRLVRHDEEILVSPPVSESAIHSLRQNLKTLNELHARLRFMLQELEELVKS